MLDETIKQLHSAIDSLQDNLSFLESINEKSGYEQAEEYIKENHLEYIGDEIRMAFRKGFSIGRLQRSLDE